MYETFRTKVKQASEKVEKFRIKFRRSVNVALNVMLWCIFSTSKRIKRIQKALSLEDYKGIGYQS